MSNKRAPYRDPVILETLQAWWDKTTTPTQGRFGSPPPSPPTPATDLYESFLDYIGLTPAHQAFFDRHQFAKCLVAARIADIGGWWEQLPDWQPLEYEVTRARLHV